MYGRKADGTKKNKKKTLFDELWEQQHPEEAAQEREEKRIAEE